MPSNSNTQHWIVSDPDHLGGKPRIRGTRISVAHLLEMLANEMAVEDIVESFPSLSRESISGALAELAREKEKVPA